MGRLEDLMALHERQAHELLQLNDLVREAQRAAESSRRVVQGLEEEVKRRKFAYEEKQRTYLNTKESIERERAQQRILARQPNARTMCLTCHLGFSDEGELGLHVRAKHSASAPRNMWRWTP